MDAPAGHGGILGQFRMRSARWLRALGPGLISGASDDDPTAIATYSQAGAAFGYQLLWLSVLCFPAMVVVQEIGARLGRTTGQGLAANLRRHYPAWLLNVCVLLLLIANTIAIGADLGGMADVVRLVVGGPGLLYVVLLGIGCIGMQILMRYRRYVAMLKWITLALLAYVAAALMAHVQWNHAASGLLPHFLATRAWIMTVVGIVGAALSPYILFWQSAQEAENQRITPHRAPLVDAPEQAGSALRRIRLDTYAGMAVATLVGMAIMITTAATLHASGKLAIHSSAQAAAALQPVAGRFAFLLFALGILGTGLLAVPVLAGSAAYAVGEARGWPVGLARRPAEAKAFYATLSLAALIGAGLDFAQINPIQALFWSAVVNGVVAAPLLALMVLMTGRRQIMGAFAIAVPLRLAGWLTAAVIAVCVAFMFAGSL